MFPSLPIEDIRTSAGHAGVTSVWCKTEVTPLGTMAKLVKHVLQMVVTSDYITHTFAGSSVVAKAVNLTLELLTAFVLVKRSLSMVNKFIFLILSVTSKASFSVRLTSTNT